MLMKWEFRSLPDHLSIGVYQENLGEVLSLPI